MDDWNGKLQNAIASITDHKGDGWRKFSAVANDFEVAASVYTQIIVSELTLPYDAKTIKPVNMGGVAGGIKYVAQGILFKFSLDVKKGNRWIYGGESRQDNLASKAASHELLSLSTLFTTYLSQNEHSITPNAAKLSFPLACVIDYRGFRIVAISHLPLESLVYGSADGGTHFVDSVPEVSSRFQELVKDLNIKTWQLIKGKKKYNVHGPVDIEIHRGTDNRYYVLDFARMCCPEYPNNSECGVFLGSSVFYYLLRPEFLAHYKVPLCSDACTSFLKRSDMEDLKKHNREVLEAAVQLHKQVIPKFVRDFLLPNFGTSVLPSIMNVIEIVTEFHQYGINLRHLGRVKAQISDRYKYLRFLILSEMVARVIKSMVKQKMRMMIRKNSGISEQVYLDYVLNFFNTLTGSKIAPFLWKSSQKGSIKQLIKEKYGTVDECEGDNHDLRQYFSMRLMFIRVTDLTSINFSSQVKTQLISKVKNFVFVKSDFLPMCPRVKKMSLVNLADAKALYNDLLMKKLSLRGIGRVLTETIVCASAALKSSSILCTTWDSARIFLFAHTNLLRVKQWGDLSLEEYSLSAVTKMITILKEQNKSLEFNILSSMIDFEKTSWLLFEGISTTPVVLETLNSATNTLNQLGNELKYKITAMLIDDNLMLAKIMNHKRINVKNPYELLCPLLIGASKLQWLIDNLDTVDPHILLASAYIQGEIVFILEEIETLDNQLVKEFLEQAYIPDCAPETTDTLKLEKIIMAMRETARRSTLNAITESQTALLDYLLTTKNRSRILVVFYKISDEAIQLKIHEANRELMQEKKQTPMYESNSIIDPAVSDTEIGTATDDNENSSNTSGDDESYNYDDIFACDDENDDYDYGPFPNDSQDFFVIHSPKKPTAHTQKSLDGNYDQIVLKISNKNKQGKLKEKKHPKSDIPPGEYAQIDIRLSGPEHKKERKEKPKGIKKKTKGENLSVDLKTASWPEHEKSKITRKKSPKQDTEPGLGGMSIVKSLSIDDKKKMNRTYSEPNEADIPELISLSDLEATGKESKNKMKVVKSSENNNKVAPEHDRINGNKIKKKDKKKCPNNKISDAEYEIIAEPENSSKEHKKKPIEKKASKKISKQKDTTNSKLETPNNHIGITASEPKRQEELNKGDKRDNKTLEHKNNKPEEKPDKKSKDETKQKLKEKKKGKEIFGSKGLIGLLGMKKRKKNPPGLPANPTRSDELKVLWARYENFPRYISDFIFDSNKVTCIATGCPELLDKTLTYLDYSSSDLLAEKILEIYPDFYTWDMFKSVLAIFSYNYYTYVLYDGTHNEKPKYDITSFLTQDYYDAPRLSEAEIKSRIKKLVAKLIEMYNLVSKLPLKFDNLITLQNICWDDDFNLSIKDWFYCHNLQHAVSLSTACPDYVGFMSPQQLAGEHYADTELSRQLAVLLFIYVNGFPPFDVLSTEKAYEQITRGSIQSMVADEWIMDEVEFSPQMHDFFQKAFCDDNTKRATIQELAEHPWLN